MIDQKEAQKMMTDDSSMHDKLDKDILGTLLKDMVFERYDQRSNFDVH